MLKCSIYQKAPVIIDNNLVLADVDSTNLNGATVKITNYKAGDQLLFTPTAGISITEQQRELWIPQRIR